MNPEQETPTGVISVAPNSFTVAVEWQDGTTQEDMDAAQAFVKEFSDNLQEVGHAEIPKCVKTLKISRE